MSELMGRNEYARHRGCAPNAVSKAEESGRIAGAVVRGQGGEFVGINWKLADELWARNTDPAEAAKNGQNANALLADNGDLNNSPAACSQQREPTGDDSEGAVAGSDLLGSSPAAADAGKDPHGYLAARADRERHQAKIAELDYLERVGELVSAAEVREEQFAIFRAHRDKLEHIPLNISERLAAETDPQRVEHQLRAAIRNTLNELSRALAIDAAAGGAEERAPATA